jgi:hypothetical protein
MVQSHIWGSAVAWLVKKFPGDMKLEASLPYSLHRNIDHYPEPIEPDSHLDTYISKIPFNILLPSEPPSSNWSLVLTLKGKVTVLN